MLVGNANIEELAAQAPTVDEYYTQAINFTDVTCFQLVAEMPNSAREALLPPSLHPTIPAAISVQVYAVQHSQWGAFQFANLRVSCRSGVRARGLSVRTVVDSENASEGLRSLLGFPCVYGNVHLRHGYDGVHAAVDFDGMCIFAAQGIDPEALGQNDVQFTGTLNLAHSPNGLRLLQVESQLECQQAERLTPLLEIFDGAGWGNKLIEPNYVVSASVCKMNLTLPAVRFVCKVDELAFTGTEPVAG